MAAKVIATALRLLVGITLALGLTALIVACGEDEDDRPRVKFTVDKNTVTPGQAAILSWEAHNTNEIMLEGPDIPPNTTSKQRKHSHIVRPTQTATYTIFAKGDKGIIQASVTITVK